MKKTLYCFAYYISVPLILLICLKFASVLLNLSGTDNLGSIIAYTYLFLFVAAPIVTIITMRFSPLRWYVDPFAAIEQPAALFFAAVINIMSRGNTFYSAIMDFHIKLSDDDGMGYLFFIAWFIVGLAFSFSIKRKHGENIAYRIINKEYHKARE